MWKSGSVWSHRIHLQGSLLIHSASTKPGNEAVKGIPYTCSQTRQRQGRDLDLKSRRGSSLLVASLAHFWGWHVWSRSEWVSHAREQCPGKQRRHTL